MAPSPLDPLLQVINREPQIADTSGAEPLQQLRGAIELSGVYFSYPARPDVQIFSGLNLSIAAGQTVALVGESGSGAFVVPLWSILPVTLRCCVFCNKPSCSWVCHWHSTTLSAAMLQASPAWCRWSCDTTMPLRAR